ncbi:MAG TPA: hypothetical protein VIJ15_06590, partial [Dermatophilaceae bacterium]
MKLSRFRRPSPASLGSVLVTLALAVMTPLAAGGALPASAAGPVLPNQYNSYHPAQPWNDMTGNPIQAHGGQVVASTEKNGERVWYWYGEDRTNGYGDTPGVHVYSSHDLYNWKDRGLALRSLSSQDQLRTDRYFAKLYRGYSPAQQEMVWRDLSTKTTRTDGWGAPSILERPKVAYNKATGKWVMWVHSDGPTSPTSTSTYERAQA